MRSPGTRLRTPLAATLVALVAALAIVGCGGGNDNKVNTSVAAANDGKPRIIAVKDLGGVGSALGHPLYWAGEQSGKSLELTITQPGNAFIRYLNRDSELASPEPDFLTIGSYPLKGAYDALKANAKNHPGTRTAQTPDGGFVLVSKDRPQSVYIVFPKQPDVEIEVYAPSASKAFETATSGDIKPVKG
jgi:hypothetical protein